MFQKNVFDNKLRLRKLIRVFDSFSLVLTDDGGRRGSLLWARIVLTALILRTNGNRRAQNYQRGGEPLQQ
jgi:hypothetical protein